jgi:signal transduction histidine kinase
MAQQRAAFDEQRRVMLLGVSHDLRSPLTRIRVAADLLEQEPALRDLIVRNVELADAIIESFLSYVRTDSEPVADAVDLSAIALNAARLAELPQYQADVTPDVTVRGNPTMLQRTLMNLLDNAARHGAPPVSLSLAVDKSRNEATLVVQDHGPGVVDPKRMLQPFERGDESRAHGGAGLGLAIVARIVERHGGTLDIGAVEPGGTRVSAVGISDQPAVRWSWFRPPDESIGAARIPPGRGRVGGGSCEREAARSLGRHGWGSSRPGHRDGSTARGCRSVDAWRSRADWPPAETPARWR